MARLWSCGWENGDSEPWIDSASGSIITSGQRSGDRAFQVTSFASAAKGRSKQFASSAPSSHYHCFWLRIDTYPNVANIIYKVCGATGLNAFLQAAIRLNTDGSLTVRHGSSGTGSTSSTIPADGTWHKVELFFNTAPASGSRVVTAWLDGTQFSNSTNSSGTASQYAMIGGALASTTPEAVTSGSWSFDDWSINDTTGSFETGRCSGGKMVHLRPNAQGDANDWNNATGGTAGAANNYTRVNEVSADDATTYNELTLSGVKQELYNCDSASGKGIGSSDTIVLVSVGGKVGSTSATAASGRDIKYSLKDTTTQLDSAVIDISVNGWAYYTDPAPNTPQLVSYVMPRNSAAWTQTELESLQIGYREGNSSGITKRVTQVFALVEYIPATTVPQVLKAERDASNTGGFTTHTGGSTNLVGEINESVADDSTYVQSPGLTPGGAHKIWRWKLNAGNPPGSGTCTLKTRYREDTAGGDTINAKSRLYQGGGNTEGAGSLIVERTYSGIGTTAVEDDYPLSGSEVSAITDWGDLWREFEVWAT